MKDKELRKALMSLTVVSQAEYDMICKATKKRPDAQRLLRDERDWQKELKELSKRIKP